MKCCSKYSGRDLREVITIERKSSTSDGMGGFNETWGRPETVRAKWQPMRGGERMQAMRVQPGLSVKAVIRFKGDDYNAPYYKAADRVTHRGRKYAITSVIGIDQEWIELMLSEGVPS